MYILCLSFLIHILNFKKYYAQLKIKIYQIKLSSFPQKIIIMFIDFFYNKKFLKYIYYNINTRDIFFKINKNNTKINKIIQ